MTGSSVQGLGVAAAPPSTSAAADLCGLPASSTHGLPASCTHGLSSGVAGTLSVLFSKRF